MSWLPPPWHTGSGRSSYSASPHTPPWRPSSCSVYTAKTERTTGEERETPANRRNLFTSDGPHQFASSSHLLLHMFDGEAEQVVELRRVGAENARRKELGAKKKQVSEIKPTR